MRKLIVTTLSALGVGLLIATPDQAKADYLGSFEWASKSVTSGQRSETWTKEQTTIKVINGVEQLPITVKTGGSSTDVFGPITKIDGGVAPFLPIPPVNPSFPPGIINPLPGFPTHGQNGFNLNLGISQNQKLR